MINNKVMLVINSCDNRYKPINSITVKNIVKIVVFIVLLIGTTQSKKVKITKY